LTPRRRSELYRLAIGLAALGAISGTGGRLAASRPDWYVVAVIAAAGILALQFPLHISVSVKVSVATAVFFASALLMSALQAAALAAAIALVDTVISVVRRVIAKREKPPVLAVSLSILFNPGQAYLSVLAAGAVLAAAGVSARSGLSLRGAVAVVVAAAAMYGANMLLVATAEALLTARNPVSLVLHKQRVVLGQFASLYLVGGAVAFAAAAFPWLVVLSLIAALLVYRSLQQRLELRDETVRAMERMADEVDRRDPYTYQHSQRVATFSRTIARRLGLSAAEIELIELAAKVHDIGKIRIPDSILLKPDRLTPDERRMMETHPRLGYDILRPFSEYARVLDLVLVHHERYDGMGYPNGNAGRGLLLIAQIIPVADSLDAMTSTRAYRPARSWEWAMEELRRGAGTQWNPRVVEAAVTALGAGEATAVRAPQPAMA
jgi:putative nucleotidyltransferase with HDIG domain